MKTLKTNLLCGILAAILAAPFAGLAAAPGSAVGERPQRAADEKWDYPHGAHVGSDDFSAFCVHDGKDAAFVIAYHGDFDSTSRSSSNAKARTWTDSVTLTAERPGIALSFHRTHTAPGKLTLTTAPAEARDLSKPAPPPRNFGQREFDLAKGRVFLLSDDGTVRQLDLAPPPVTDREGADKLAKLIAAIPPPAREDIAQPKHKNARELYEIWQRLARGNGDIPGALVGELAAAVRQFITYNPTWETVPQLNAILPRLDATRDWTAAETIALLDELAAVKDSPLDMASWRARPLRQGEKLPEKFAEAAWHGAPGGLRAAWVLEPTAAQYRVGTALRARLLVWNPGAVAVALQVPTFHQGGVTATNAQGAEVEVVGIHFLTLADSVPVRLGPGEFIEINTPGVGIGERAGREPWAGPRVGFNVLAKPGTDITLTHSPIPLDGSEGGIREDQPQFVGAGWWLAYIKSQLARQLPLPADAAERTRLLERAVRDLFGIAPTAEEIAAFTADQRPGALDALAKRLAERADAVEFAGSLPPAPVKIRVLAADSAEDKIPRVALGPGEYRLPSTSALRGDATLKIVGRPVGERVVNDTKIIFEATEATGKLAPESYKLEIPDGWGNWAIVCRPSDGFFYVLHKGGARKIDFSDPRKVTDTPATDVPAEFRDEAKQQLESAGASAETGEVTITVGDAKAAAPGAAVKLTPDALLGAWRGTLNDKKLMLSFHRPPVDEAVHLDIYEGDATIGALARFTIAADGGSAVVGSGRADSAPFGTLRPGEAGTLKLELHSPQKGQKEVVLTHDVEEPATEPRQKEPRELFELWKATANEDGTIPGTFIGQLATEVRAYVKANPTYDSAAKLPKLLPRFVTSRDWTPAAAIKLLDDVAYYSTAPIAALVAEAPGTAIRGKGR